MNKRMVFAHAKITANLGFLDLGVVDMKLRLFLQKTPANVNRRGFPGVVGVLFKGKA